MSFLLFLMPILEHPVHLFRSFMYTYITLIYNNYLLSVIITVMKWEHAWTKVPISCHSCILAYSRAEPTEIRLAYTGDHPCPFSLYFEVLDSFRNCCLYDVSDISPQILSSNWPWWRDLVWETFTDLT